MAQMSIRFFGTLNLEEIDDRGKKWEVLDKMCPIPSLSSKLSYTGQWNPGQQLSSWPPAKFIKCVIYMALPDKCV